MAELEDFSGEIVVASRIVDYLSSGLYESPAACLKELINNSYDADATRVGVFVKPDADRIIIHDNGQGMDRADFVRHFSRISESHKREESGVTERGRPKIGKIGIGFIAANEICDVMEIVSTKAGSNELLHVRIFFDKMRLDPTTRRRKGGDFAKGDYKGEVSETDEESHYTHVFLKRVRGEARAILAGAKTSSHTSGERSLYGLAANSIKKVLRDSNVKSWAELDSYSQNFLQIGLNVPVNYYNDWLPSNIIESSVDLYEDVASLDFSLFIDGSQVFKPIIFAPAKRSLLSRFKIDGEHVTAKGYFYAQHGAIKPQDLQGLLVRIRNAAIGDYDRSFLGFSPSEGPLFQSWISAEICADDRLEDAMNIDRRTLRVAHPAFVELQSAIHDHLSSFIKKVRAELYGEGSRRRKHDRAQKAVSSLVTIADEDIAPIAPAAAAEMKARWGSAAQEERGVKRLLRKFTVAELYRIVIEVAEDLLTAEQMREFINRLTVRLDR